MASRGDGETLRLKQNIEDQVKRLLQQLQDIEEMKDELDEDEYVATRQDTIDQLKEFEISLGKLTSGNMSLVDSSGSVQLAIQNAIRSHVSPDLLNKFSQKEHESLRLKLGTLESDLKLGRISREDFAAQACVLVRMLEKMGLLSETEKSYLDPKGSTGMMGYTLASSEVGSGVINSAVRGIDNAEKL